MNSTFRSSESLPSLHSFQSLQKRFNESHHSSVHLLAYLAQDSTRSLKNITSRELNEVNLNADGSPGERHEVWWSDFIELKPFKLRPLSNFGVNLTAGSVLANRVEASRPSGAPTRPRHRPPALELDPRIVSSRKENVAPSSAKLSPISKPSPKEAELDSSSPWHILNQFPTPPSTPLLIRRSKTNTSLCKPSRKANKVPLSSAPIPGNPSKERVENKPPIQAFRKKRHTSFGSLGKTFKATPALIPCTPPSIPPAWLQFDPMCEKESDTKSLPGLQRRETFKSRLFTFSASPKASPRDFGTGHRKLSSQPDTFAIPHDESRVVSESARKSLSLRRSSKHQGTRSRSASQPTHFKGRRDKMEPDTLGSSENIDIPLSPTDLEKHLIIPKRRTQSQSYINLYVPPWKQVGSSPTQISFSVEEGVSSMPATPIGGNFDSANEIMHLPASESVESLNAEIDPFGAGEPTSFFRSDFGEPMDTVEVDQATSIFYDNVGMGTRTSRKRWPLQQSVVVHHIPDIVVSSSRGLEELKRRDWMHSN